MHYHNLNIKINNISIKYIIVIFVNILFSDTPFWCQYLIVRIYPHMVVVQFKWNSAIKIKSPLYRLIY